MEVLLKRHKYPPEGMTEQEKRQHRCCFAGHRPEGILLTETTIKSWLREKINSSIATGFTTFITGMGMGVDIWAAQILIELRTNNPSLHLIAVEPYPGFSAKWNEEWQTAYRDVLQNADLVKQLSTHYSPEASEARGKWLVDHSARLIAIYNGMDGYTGSLVRYAKEKHLQIELYPFPKITRTEARPYPLNLIDAIMDCSTYLAARPVDREDLPADFERRLAVVLSTLPDERATDIILARFHDGATLQTIGDELGLSRERVRQLVEKYLRKLRQPDILRYLDCGIDGIPEKTVKAVVKRLQENESLPPNYKP